MKTLLSTLCLGLVFASHTLFGLEPVPSEKLILLLPDAPEGWRAEEPAGSTTESEAAKISVAGRSYIQVSGTMPMAGEEEDEPEAPTVSINITDSGGDQAFIDATQANWVTDDTLGANEGFARQTAVDGLLGFETYDVGEKTSVLWVIVGGRFFVQVEMQRRPPAELKQWLGRLDLKKLASFK